MVKETESRIRVAICAHDGTAKGYGEYLGVIDSELLRQLLGGERSTGWFAIDDCYWERTGEIVRQSLAGRTWGYGDTTYLRLENVMRIIPLPESPETKAVKRTKMPK